MLTSQYYNMLRNPGVFYYNPMIPHYAVTFPPMLKTAQQKSKKKKHQYIHSVNPYKRKRFSLSYYLKYVLWRKIRRYWKKRRARSKKKKVTKPPNVSVLGNRGSDEQIDTRDFWGSKYGSQWLFAKQKLQQQQLQHLQKIKHNHLIEIVDAFKTVDLKYAKAHQFPEGQSSRTLSNTNHRAICRRSVAGSNSGYVTPRRSTADFSTSRQSVVTEYARSRRSAADSVVDCAKSRRSAAESIADCARSRRSAAESVVDCARSRRTIVESIADCARSRRSTTNSAIDCAVSRRSITDDQSSRSRKSMVFQDDVFNNSRQMVRSNAKCPCVRRKARVLRGRKDGFETDCSDWSLSTLQCHQRPYSKWPPHPPPGAKHCCGREEQLATLLARQHAYVYNWLYVDQLQNKCKLSLSREYLDEVRNRLANVKGASRRQHRNSCDSSSRSSTVSWTSTLSRRERAKIIKRQIRAKEKASVLWLLSKAFGDGIPVDLQEPFYRDQDNIRRLKPKIVQSLSTAELYCLALVNIYSDPNYHNLDHQGIIQVLTRKGINLMESREASLTETTLVQTAPIRMSAHMAVIDGIMSLYIKEVLIPEKIVEVIKSFSSVDINSEMPSNSEEAAVLWINKCCKALEQDIRTECSTEEECKLPKIPVLQEIADVSDGCCIAAVISYYCPKYLSWQDVCWNNPISLGDSIYNLQLVKNFCSKFLPKEINFLSLEDLLYLHPSIKENVLVFVADLLYMFVICKATCVTPKKKSSVVQESSHTPLESSKSLSSFQSHRNPTPCSPIPNLRSDSYGGSTSSLPDIRPGSRARIGGSKENLCEKVLRKKSNFPDDMGPNELQRTNSVGMVNGWKTTNLPHVGSTDSVPSSPRTINQEITRPPVEGESASSHHSHPSICSAEENGLPKHLPHTPLRTSLCFQGSPQREMSNFGLRKSTETTPQAYRLSGEGHVVNGGHESRKARKSLEEYYNQLAGFDGPMRSISASNIIDSRAKRSANSVPESSSSQSSGICLSDFDVKNAFSTTSFAQLSKHKESSGSSINIVYMPHEKEENTSVKRVEGEGKKTTFAALPNTTTWQQQHAVNSHFPQTDSGHETPTEHTDTVLNAQLCNIKMKLEDKKRKIELKKKRMEMLWKKQRQKLGKAAFLQAVSKSPGTPDSGNGKEVIEVDVAKAPALPSKSSSSMVKGMSMQEIAVDLDNVQKKWLNQHGQTEQILEFSVEPSIDSDSINIDLQTSIEHLNTSLTDLEADISRISLQQEQVESFMTDSIDDASHFFLHSPSTETKTLPSVTPTHWQFNESPVNKRQGIYFSSSQLEDYSMLQNHPDFETSQFSSLLQSIPTQKEELYSKVNKVDKKRTVGLPSRTPPPSMETLAIISADPRRRNMKPKSSSEIHVVLPQVPDSKPSEANFASKKGDGKQGFYIPMEKEGKKLKSKSPRTLKGTNGECVPNSVVTAKKVPTKTTDDSNSLGFVIGADLVHPDPEAETEMARKKEIIMNLSIRRKAEYESKRVEKEKELARIKEEERRKQEYQERKREEEKRRREVILEQYRQRKLQEELEKEGASMPKEMMGKYSSRTRPSRRESKPRPKSAYVHADSDLSTLLSLESAANKRNSQFFPGREITEFDLDSLNSVSTTASSQERNRNSLFPLQRNSNLQLPEGSGPSSDGASDTASNGSSAAAGDYTGPKLFVKPAAKSNRGIIINAINTVLAGAVNEDTKKKVLEEIIRSESKHFLILFRDAGCQFRALYTYNPDREEVAKLYGIGPKNIVDKMMERFYKYNSGGKCFSEIQTKHLTVTIDAFTIPNSLWAGKRLVPPKKEFF